ncbi:MAG: YjdJ family protein [Carnobacterium alterfunditum]
MSFRNMVLLVGAFVTFVFATLVSWYEGGQLRDYPWEWEHTAIFSNWVNDGFTNAENLLVIDHFIYAAKFEPLFPLLMASSFFWMVFQLIFWLFKGRRAVRNTLLLLITIASFTMCGILFDSPIAGFKLFSLFFGVVGLLTLLGVFLIQDRKDRGIATG